MNAKATGIKIYNGDSSHASLACVQASLGSNRDVRTDWEETELARP